MKKRKAAFILSLFVNAIVLSSCAETPKERIVVDRSRGISQEYILPAETNKIAKDLKLPERWTDEIRISDGWITLAADCEIEIPPVYNTPVYSYEMLPLTKEKLKELCDYFSEGKPIYRESPMTKAELEKLKAEMQRRLGVWGRYGGRIPVSSIIKQTEALIEKAPEVKAEKEYIEPEFDIPYQMEEELLKGIYTWSWFQYYYDTKEKVGLTARVDAKEQGYPLIRAVNDNKDVGSTSKFMYRRGTFVDEIMLEHAKNTQNENTRNKDYIQYMEEKMGSEPETISEEDAKKKAGKILRDLSIQDMELADCTKTIGYADLYNISDLCASDEPLTAGYSLYYYKKAGDLTGYNLAEQIPGEEGLPETVYSPLFPCERVHITLTGKGIQQFEWTGISKRNRVIAENTRLLTFDKIKEKLAEHLLYEHIQTAGIEAKDKGLNFIYTAENVQLRAANINAFEEPYAVWLAPIWVFSGYETMIHGDRVTLLPPKTIMINALDGGYVRGDFN